MTDIAHHLAQPIGSTVPTGTAPFTAVSHRAVYNGFKLLYITYRTKNTEESFRLKFSNSDGDVDDLYLKSVKIATYLHHVTYPGIYTHVHISRILAGETLEDPSTDPDAATLGLDRISLCFYGKAVGDGIYSSEGPVKVDVDSSMMGTMCFLNLTDNAATVTMTDNEDPATVTKTITLASEGSAAISNRALYAVNLPDASAQPGAETFASTAGGFLPVTIEWGVDAEYQSAFVGTATALQLIVLYKEPRKAPPEEYQFRLKLRFITINSFNLDDLSLSGIHRSDFYKTWIATNLTA